MTEAPSVSDFPAHVVAALTPESKATFVNQMVAAGHSKEAVEAKLAPPQPVAPVNDAAPNAESIRYLRENWTGDKATLDILLAQLDTKNPGVTGAIPPSLQAPADAAEYHLAYGDYARLVDGEDLAAMHSEVTSGFKAAEIPTNMGQPVLSAMLSSMDAMDGLNVTQANSYKAEQRGMLAKVGDVSELVHLAAIGLVGMPQKTVDMLRERGALESANVIATLASIGRSREWREGKKS